MDLCACSGGPAPCVWGRLFASAPGGGAGKATEPTFTQLQVGTPDAVGNGNPVPDRVECLR